MKPFHWIVTSWLAIVLSAAFCAVAEPAKAPDDFLQVRGTELYLHGKPFYEISFNKFDLFWQLQDAELGRKGHGPNPAASAEKALKTLHDFGFKTLRVFCNGSADAAKQPHFLAAMDRMLELCDRYDIRLVFSLGNFGDNYVVPGETFVDLIAREDSKSRQMARQYVRDMVLRYRDRKTIALWEHGNELLLKADIGGRTRTWNHMKIPTLEEIARFHAQEAAFIRSLDPNHPVTTGDSYRNGLWNLYQFGQGKSKVMWGVVDTMADLGRGVAMAQKGVDVFCIHNYYHSLRYGCHEVMGTDGKLTAVNLDDWTKIAHAQGQPLYIGEYSAMPVARTEKQKKFWDQNPQWFESYTGADREKAEQIVQTALERILAAQPNLTHWWCYQSDRTMDQTNPQRFDVDWERTPKLVRLIAQANRKLQMATMGFTYAKVPAGEP